MLRKLTAEQEKGKQMYISKLLCVVVSLILATGCATVDRDLADFQSIPLIRLPVEELQWDVDRSIELVYVPFVHGPSCDKRMLQWIYKRGGHDFNSETLKTLQQELTALSLLGMEGVLAGTDYRQREAHVLAFLKADVGMTDAIAENMERIQQLSQQIPGVELQAYQEAMSARMIMDRQRPVGSTDEMLIELAQSYSGPMVGVENKEAYCRHVSVVREMSLSQFRQVQAKAKARVARWTRVRDRLSNFSAACALSDKRPYCQLMNLVDPHGAGLIAASELGDPTPSACFNYRPRSLSRAEFKTWSLKRVRAAVKTAMKAAQERKATKAVFLYGLYHIGEISELAKQQNIRLRLAATPRLRKLMLAYLRKIKKK